MNLPQDGIGSADSALILVVAALLDYWIGDPWGWLHPVQVMGWGIQHYTTLVLRTNHPLSQRLAGIGLTVGLISASAGTGGLLVWLARLIHPGLAVVTASILLASCFAGRSLRHAALDVLEPLQQGDVVTARSRLSRYVGRDTDGLSEPDILRAVLETVTENAVDGVMAPLFWAIVGAGLPWGSVPFALAYKAASTLDSMVGYRDAPYTHIGWCSARLEDWLTWMPCRLTVVSLGLLSGHPLQVWRLCRRDAPQDPSPNAGWSECAYAAVLGVQVGGENRYRGAVKLKPQLGDALRPITPDIIDQAMTLTRINVLIWLAISILVIIVL